MRTKALPIALAIATGPIRRNITDNGEQKLRAGCTNSDARGGSGLRFVYYQRNLQIQFPTIHTPRIWDLQK